MMAERRKGRKKKEIDTLTDEKPTKLEFEVAKYLRSKLPLKKTTLLGNKVDYFIASKAIDCLLDSKWATKDKSQKQVLFTTRESVVNFMANMLKHKLFHRAKKIIVVREKKLNQDESGTEDKDKKKSKIKEDKDKSRIKSKEKDKENELVEGKKDESKKEDGNKDGDKKKEVKKIKLNIHFEQIFVDANEPYVWLYDPVPLKAWIIGAGFVFGAVAICLFPLWPKIVRDYVYYLSVLFASLLFFIITLTVLRLIIFVIVWLLTFGKHSFWILPNLTEDVGPIESFWPLYQYEYKGEVKKDKDKEDEGERKKLLNKDNNDKPNESRDISDEASDRSKRGSKEGSQERSKEVSSEEEATGEHSDSSVNKNGGTDNGFEILDSNDIQDESDPGSYDK